MGGTTGRIKSWQAATWPARWTSRETGKPGNPWIGGYAVSLAGIRYVTLARESPMSLRRPLPESNEIAGSLAATIRSAGDSRIRTGNGLAAATSTAQAREVDCQESDSAMQRHLLAAPLDTGRSPDR